MEILANQGMDRSSDRMFGFVQRGTRPRSNLRLDGQLFSKSEGQHYGYPATAKQRRAASRAFARP